MEQYAPARQAGRRLMATAIVGNVRSPE